MSKSTGKSTTTSQLLKQKSDSPVPIDKRSKKKNLTNLQDIESILNDLETEESLKADKSARRYCNCLARRHPLFEIAPNCLNCGKIICTKEGLQPCSFCGADIIPTKDKEALIDLLSKEREDILLNKNVPVQTPSTSKSKKKIVVKMNPGEKFWEAQDRAFKAAEEELKKKEQALSEVETPTMLEAETERTNEDLDKAKARLETLLDYQATGEERTKIIDNAADFEMPTQSIWLTPEERALNLKKQQRLAREKEKEKDRQQRGEKTVEMTIKDGKVTMVEKHITTKEAATDEESKLEQTIKDKKKQSQESNYEVWDYEKEKLKYTKPIYFSNRTEKSSTVPNNLPQPKYRVQVAEADTSELIATLIN
ncbi:uncharacterized protein J8A68_003024 [[Candida] subhashii]|uniref:TRIP4/RQT4 C2HC5-type zinc finger domain-containing protein n=1 Tax=[Candida] subhashii TaxID=561895 RepID=A0A8J5QI77_9ASCO|nr:uncharacterized protein J8A68_003024 [[Candida] subhashii]KAG7663477.1 hypothetical protein J8A68_003024 [[Candida] subhashii]